MKKRFLFLLSIILIFINFNLNAEKKFALSLSAGLLGSDLEHGIIDPDTKTFVDMSADWICEAKLDFNLNSKIYIWSSYGLSPMDVTFTKKEKIKSTKHFLSAGLGFNLLGYFEPNELVIRVELGFSNIKYDGSDDTHEVNLNSWGIRSNFIFLYQVNEKYFFQVGVSYIKGYDTIYARKEVRIGGVKFGLGAGIRF